MIGFSTPTYVDVEGVKLAVFTVADTPGSQYVYRNRDMTWLHGFLANGSVQGVGRAINFWGPQPTDEQVKTPESVAGWWKEHVDDWTFEEGHGCVVRLRPLEQTYPPTYRMPGNLFVFVLCHGRGGDVVNGDPLHDFWFYNLPHKIRRRRKWEVRGRDEWREYGRARFVCRDRDLYENLFSPKTPELERFRRLTYPRV